MEAARRRAGRVNGRRPLIILFGLAVTALLTACSSTDTGSPTAASTTTDPPSAPTSTSAQTAPRVASPLNVGQFTATPCSALTVADLPALKLTGSSAQAKIAYGAPVCEWNPQDAEHTLAISWISPKNTGLSALYSQRSDMEYWQTLSVDGYPAVFADFADLRTHGDCRINVGVNDAVFFIADYQTIMDSDKPQACNLAQTAAADVIKNLQGGR